MTSLGRAQAEEAAIKIKEHNLQFDVVLCSPLVRAKETAKVIVGVSDQPDPIIHPLLIERDFGEMTGLPVSSIKMNCAPDIIETETITYFLSPKGAETFPDLLDRARRLLNDLSQSYDEKLKILLVCHGDIGKMIYAAYYDLSWKKVLTQFHFGNSEVLRLSPDSSPEETHIFEIEQENH